MTVVVCAIELNNKYLLELQNIKDCTIVNEMYNEVPDVVIFGNKNIDDGFIEKWASTRYLYAPSQTSKDYYTKEWLMDYWQPCTTEEFRFKLKNLIKHIMQDKENEINNIFLDAVINLSNNMIWFKSIDGKHLLVNNVFRKMTQKNDDEIVNKYHNDIWGMSEEQKLMGKCICIDSDAIVLSLGWDKVFAEKLTLPNNIVRDMSTHKAPMRDKYGKIIGTVGIATDVTKQIIESKKLEHAMSHDYLSGVYNRQYFMTQLNKDIYTPYTIYFFDLDNFKQLNDKYGHQTGDKAIVLFSTVLQEIFVNDIVARYGGDEFVVAQRGVNNNFDDTMLKLDEKMKCLASDERFENLLVSCGICQYMVGDNMDKIVALADIGMYRAKTIHKNNDLKTQYNKALTKVFYVVNNKMTS